MSAVIKKESPNGPDVIPAGYKRTEIGVIPQDWDVLPVRVCLRKSPGYGINAAAVAFDDTLPVYLRITDISEDGQFAPSPKVSVQHSNAAAYFLTEGDLVFARTGASVGKSYLYNPSDGPLVFAGFLIRVTPDPTKLEPAFLANYMRSKRYWDWVRMMSTRSGQPGINGQEYGTLQLPVPGTKEQRAIAGTLSDVDVLLGALDKLIAKKRAIKQAAMQQLLTGKTRLPRFKREWETTRLGSLLDRVLGGGTPTRSNPKYWGDEIPWMTVKDFATFHPRHTQESITREGLQRSASHLIPKGTLIISTRMALGKAVTYEVDVAINQDMKALFLNQNMSNQYLYYWFEYHADDIDALGSGSTVKGISLSALRNIEFYRPELAEQQAIATVLSDMDAEIAALEQRRDKTKAIKQGMMQALLTGRIRLVGGVSCHVGEQRATAEARPHNWQINEAVVISVLTKDFGSEAYPLGRKRYTKLSYLLHRHAERKTEGYLKKAAGPYNPRMKYAGPEKIALENSYVREHKSGNLHGFVSGDKVDQAEAYFEKWYGAEARAWLKQFRFKTNDELELLTTVDLALEDLRSVGKSVSLEGVKDVIGSHPEWKAKLARPIFSDANIAQAVRTCARLFQD